MFTTFLFGSVTACEKTGTHTIADDHMDEQKAKDWLGGVAAENDNIKDMVLHDLWKNEDFLGA